MKKTKVNETKKFFREVIDGKNDTSSKRLVTLIISAHFIVASFAILFIAFYVMFHIPKGQVDEKLLNLLREVLEYDFYIILSGLGFITAEGAVNVMIERAKAKVAMFSQSVQSSVTETTTLPQEEPFHGEKNQE